MVILFIARRYPPSRGGMEKMAYELHEHLSKHASVELVKWGGSGRWLPAVFVIFFFKSMWILLTKKVDVVYLGDGVLAPLGFLFKLFHKQVAITIHALDIVYSNKIYQFIVSRCVANLDRIICVSDYTKEECVKRGVGRNKIVVIPNGIVDGLYIKNKNVVEMKEKLGKKMSIFFGSKKVIISVGRLVKRKGFHWFVGSVIPELLKRKKDFVYILIGKGALKRKIIDIIREKGLSGNVCMVGEVDDETLKILYNVADIFVMPNIHVKGNAEGFGIVALEAASCRLPVVASNIEGIKDALRDYKNAFLLSPLNATAYVEAIDRLFVLNEERKTAKEDPGKFIVENYNWDTISKKYLKELRLIS